MRGTMPSLPRTRKRTSRKAAQSLRLMPVNSAWIASPFEIAGDPFFIAEVLEQQRRVRKYSLLVATSTKHFIKQHVGAYSARCSIFNITITQRINVDNNYIPMVNKIHLAPLRQQKLVEEYNLLLSSASLSSLVSSSNSSSLSLWEIRPSSPAGSLPATWGLKVNYTSCIVSLPISSSPETSSLAGPSPTLSQRAAEA